MKHKKQMDQMEYRINSSYISGHVSIHDPLVRNNK